MYNCAVLLAAGEGKRMKSATSKVLHKVCGKEMVNHVIDALREANIEDINVIVGKKAEEVQSQTKSRNVSFSFQKQQLGTGHAVKCAKEFLQEKKGNVAIFTGDAPLITSDTIKTLMEYHESNNFHGTILTSIIDNPTGYGRVLRKTNGEVDQIIEHKDCSEEELRIKEINAGMYCFNIQNLLQALNKLDNNNAQGEYYLTDVIEILKKDGKKVGALPVNFKETMGVNSRVQLAEVEAIMRKRINAMHLENGVTIIDPNNTYIDCDVVIHNDSIVYPGNVLQGKTKIKENCILYPNSRIVDSVIEKDVVIQNSVILQSNIGEHTTVGPFAYIRPDSNIGSSVRIGDFVEIKKSTIGNNTKVSHLTYIGDASVGERCNFGCGTVVVNYDGKEKHKTIVGDDVFIGCNANLVSPVEVKDNSYIAAGSTITKEVPKGALGIARSRQINKENWVKKKDQK